MKIQTKLTSLNNDPFQVFESLVNQYECCFLLETLADKFQPQTSGQSYIGVAPSHKYAALEDMFFTDGVSERTDQPFTKLRDQISFDPSLRDGYVGGLVGYFAHEAVHHIENDVTFNYDRNFFDFEFARFDDGLIFQPNKAPEYFYYNQDRSALYEGRQPVSRQLAISYVGASKDATQYEKMIGEAHTAIQNGRVFQVVLANRYEYNFDGSLLRLYKELRAINPSPFMFYLKFGNVVTIGASPELLAHTNSKHQVFLEALAGTIKRGSNDGEDEVLAQQLLADEKEVAEHSMLVDLARNDVGRISEIGSVKIEDLMYIKKLSHVQHISSIVSGTMSPDKDAFDALASSFPAGTLSGAPKIEALKIISELESCERGPYGGTIGYFSYNGNSVHAVNIRSVSAIDGRLFMHSGSGVVYDSQAEREYQEICEKKAAMDRAMKPFMKDQVS